MEREPVAAVAAAVVVATNAVMTLCVSFDWLDNVRAAGIGGVLSALIAVGAMVARSLVSPVARVN